MSLDFNTILLYSVFMNTTGFPSPAQGYEEKPIDLNCLLIKNPASSFIMKYEGCSQKEEGIEQGDYLVVDCARSPEDGSLAVVRHEDIFICVRLHLSKKEKNQVLYYTRLSKIYRCTEVFGCVKAVVRLV